jgi:uncharacterized protein (TIGR02996 family)
MPDAVTTMLDAIALDPADDAAWLALADCLEDEGRPREAEVARLRERLRHMKRDDPGRPADEGRMQQLLAEGVTPIGPARLLRLTHGAAMEFRLIPPGTFWMGSPPDEPGRQANEALRLQRIERGFWLATTLTTRGQTRPGGGDHPVEIDWDDFQTADLSRCWGRSVRLPTEAEWEYACRAGTTSACHGGDLLSLPRVGWCSYGEHSRSRLRTKPVRQFIPNAWGLYDMHGNLWEWCQGRIVKGGSCLVLPTMCRSAVSVVVQPDHGAPATGVRYLIELD